MMMSRGKKNEKKAFLSFLSHHDRSPNWLCAVTGREGGGEGGVMGWGKDWYKPKTSSFISVSSCQHSWEQPREISLPRSRFLWGGALRDDTKNGCEGDYGK